MRFETNINYELSNLEKLTHEENLCPFCNTPLVTIGIDGDVWDDCVNCDTKHNIRKSKY